MTDVIVAERVEKLFAGRGGYIAMCGEAQNAELARRWYQSSADVHDDHKPELGERFSGLVLRDKVLYRVDDGLVEYRLDATLAALGSGKDIALGAMAAGADAVNAVKIAARFDPGTNARVQYVTVDGDHGVVE